MELQPGTVVGDRYVVEAPLGRGGMAVVYRIRQLSDGSRHALKVLDLINPAVHHRLHREGKVQQRLGHVNVVAVTEVLVVNHQPALVLELVPGPTLSSLLRQVRPTVPEIDALAVGILRGVAAAHAAGVVHRDLKPGNVLVAVEGRRLVPKVTDFGLAKALVDDGSDPSHTRSSATLGTPQYMAPEQLRNARDVDARADVWALGALLYELCCGEPAFPQQDQVELVQAVAAGAFVPLRDRVPDLPERMLAAVEVAMSVDADARPESASALCDRWSDGEPVPAWSDAVLDAASDLAHDASTADGDTVMPSPPVDAATWAPDAPASALTAPTEPTVPPDARPTWAGVGALAFGVVGLALAATTLGWSMGRQTPVSVGAPAAEPSAALAEAATSAVPVDPLREPVDDRWTSALERTQGVVDRARFGLLAANFATAEENAEWSAAASGLRRLDAVIALCKMARGQEFSAQHLLSERARLGGPRGGVLGAVGPGDRIASLEAWITANPDDWLALVWRLQLADHDAVEVRSRHLAALQDGYADAPLTWWAAAGEHLRQGRGEAALEAAERGLGLAPDNPWLQLQQARALEQLGRLDAAWAAVAAVQDHPRPVAEADLVAADVLLGLGRGDEAAEVVATLLQGRHRLGLGVPLAVRHSQRLVTAGRSDEAVALLEDVRGDKLRDIRPVEMVRLSLALAPLRADAADRQADLARADGALTDTAIPSDVRAVLRAQLAALREGATPGPLAVAAP